MNTETDIATTQRAFELGQRIIHKRGELGTVIEVLPESQRPFCYRVRLDCGGEEAVAEGELFPATPSGVDAQSAFAEKTRQAIAEWVAAPNISTPEQIEAEVQRIESEAEALRAVDAATNSKPTKTLRGEERLRRHRFAVGLTEKQEKVETAWHRLETTEEDPRAIAADLSCNGITVNIDNFDIDDNSEAAIPAFDPSVMNGVYLDIVRVAVGGTTIPPQFAYGIAKTIVGLKMAARVRFEGVDAEPRIYLAMLGESGTGKGTSWRRVFRALHPHAAAVDLGIETIASFDSGAGLRDLFFEQPLPVLAYIDEIESLGNKATSTRNPAILDTTIELADSTHISRVLAKRDGGGTKSKLDARLAMIMCGQNGSVYAKAFAGRGVLGLWDRITPEYAAPVEPGDLPPIDDDQAINLLLKINALDYSGAMTIASEAKKTLEDFWQTQPIETRKKARWRKNLFIDAFMSAFGSGRNRVKAGDAEIAIKIFIRQVVIRRVCFGLEIPDRTGFYLSAIKRITENMRQQLKRGIPVEQVAQTQRDYERLTSAARDNEEHLFARAWETHLRGGHLAYIDIKKANGQKYRKYVPAEE